jgi:hypothetical protein
MQCEDIRDRLIDVTADDLASTERDVREHLNKCERCRQSVQRSGSIWALLDGIPEETPDWSRMRARFAETLEVYRSQSRMLWWVKWRPAFTAVVIVAALVAGVLVGRQLPAGGRSSNQDLQAMREQLGELREMLTLSLMQQALASDRMKGASWAAQLDNPRPDVLTALIDVLLHDSNVNVRLASLRALERFEERPAVRRAVERALTDEHSSLVSIALIDFIVEINDNMAIATLRELSANPMRDQAVRERASQALDRLLQGGRG